MLAPHHRKWVVPALLGLAVVAYLALKKGQGGAAGIAQTAGQADPNQAAAQSLAAQAAAQYQQYQQGMAAIQQQYGSIASPLSLGKDKGGNQEYSYGQGPVSKAWQQITGGQWEDIYHPGHIITDSQAQALASQDSGPYARGGGGFFGQLFSGLANLGRTYAATQGVPVPNTPPIVAPNRS